MKEVILDTETNALKDYDKLHVVVLRDLHSDNYEVFRNVHEDIQCHRRLSSHLDGVELIIGHHIIGFDLGVLRKFNLRNRYPRVIDTLVLSRLVNYNQKEGHSLEAWGEYFKEEKSKFNDFTQWSQGLEDRCIKDTLINKKLYELLRPYVLSQRWQRAIELEHKIATLGNTIGTNGFTFDYNTSLLLLEEISSKVDTLENSFKDIFPKKSVCIREVIPKVTQKGTLHSKDFRWLDPPKDLTPYSADCPFSLFKYEEFNFRSPSQIVERLNSAGWKPVNKTKGHIQAEKDRDEIKLKEYRVYGWKIDEENLSTLPEDAPEATRKLAEAILLESRLGDLREWNSAYSPASGRIHGNFNGIGSWTHRMSHQKPNMANIPALINRHGKEQPYGREFRALWQSAAGYKLVGVDAEGIQLRVFAHYSQDDRLIKAISEGKKEDKTDIHSLNLKVLAPICNSRDTAKTLIYALLLGASISKVALILRCTKAQASEAIARILKYYPGWKNLKEGKIKKDAQKGYFEGLDGRLVLCPDEHRVLSGYLQNGEAIVMKSANVLWDKQLQDLEAPYKQVNFVHDEWQVEVLDQDDWPQRVARVQTQSIVDTGVKLKLLCPLAGSFKIGNNWAETH